MQERVAIRATIPGPWGPFHVAATARGVVALEYLTTDDAFEAGLARRGVAAGDAAGQVDGGDPRRRHLDAATAGVEALLAGRAPAEEVAIDLSDRPTWDQHVLAAVVAVPWGTTASYGAIARAVGAPRAARAVGGALGRNPISLLIPCHRVIAADGSIGGYGGDAWGGREDRLAIKRALLAREGIEIEVPSPRA